MAAAPSGPAHERGAVEGHLQRVHPLCVLEARRGVLQAVDVPAEKLQRSERRRNRAFARVAYIALAPKSAASKAPLRIPPLFESAAQGMPPPGGKK